MKKYKVLHIMPGFGGGISSHVRNLVNGIDPERLQIDVAGFTDYPDYFVKEVKNKNGKVFVLDNVRLHKLPYCLKQCLKIMREGKYDAVHLHLTELQAVYFSLLARLSGIKRVIVHSHIADQPDTSGFVASIRYNLFRKLTLAAATDLASCSKIASAFRFGDRYVRANKVMHIPNSINVEKYENDISEEEKMELKKELNISENAVVLGNVGYFGYQKNHPFMLEIINELKNKGWNFVWLFIGTGRDFDMIRKKAFDMGITDYCRFLGRRNDVHKLFQIMDCSVLPSHYEGLPTVAIESQAAGTPIVVSDAVTNEIDMGLGLVESLSLLEDTEKWCGAIERGVEKARVDGKTRISCIEQRCFTSSTAANLYTAYIQGAIKHYNLGDKVEYEVD